MNRQNILLTILLCLISTLIISGFIIGAWDTLTNWLYPKDINKNANSLKLLFSLIGGLVIIIGLYISYKRVLYTEKSVNIQKDTLITQNEVIKNQTKEIELSRKAQLNEQFKIAVEHIGNKNKAVVIGGLIEMVFLAEEDSSKYAEIVHKIFCSYLQSIASLKLKESELDVYLIQNIIDLLFNSDVLNNKKSNLDGLNFYSCEFKNLNFSNVNFSNSIMPRKIFNCDFNFCVFNNTKFINNEIELRFMTAFSKESNEADKISIIKDVNYKNCKGHIYFYFSRLSNIDFQECDQLFIISFTNCTLNSVKGKKIFMPGSSHYFTQFSNFKIETDIKHTNYYCCDFQNLDFSEIIIERCEFAYCKFTNLKMENKNKKLDFRNNRIIELRSEPKKYYNINFVPINDFLDISTKFSVEDHPIYKYSSGKVLVGNTNSEYKAQIKKSYENNLRSFQE